MGLRGRALAASRERPLELAAPPTRGARLAPHWLARLEATLPTAAAVVLPLEPGLQERTAAALGTALGTLGKHGADDAAALVIHNPTGEVRAWVGSGDWSNPGHGQVDATRAPRQPGSALKPFTYALGFEAGLRPSSLLPDLALEYGSGHGNFRPRNYTGEYHGPVRARTALANSWNAAAVALLSGVGPERLRLLLRAAGISTLEQPGNSYGVGLTLGDAEVTLADLTAAYAALARGGTWRPRVEVLESRRADGSLLRGPGALRDSAGAPPPIAQILDPRTAFLVTAVLADPLARARAFGLDGPFAFPFPVAIKTGTSSDWRDNWAFGYTSEWTVGTWVGRAGGEGMDRVSGTNGAILALREILLFLEEGRPERTFAEEFPPPAGMSQRTVCALSGMEVGPDCPETLDDWFHAEDPIGPSCTWHRRVALDAASGNLARRCTPAGRMRHVLFTLPDLPETGTAKIIPWKSEAFLVWCADRGWTVPPTLTAECLCGDPGCTAIDPPPGPGRGTTPPRLAPTDPAVRAHAILAASGPGVTGLDSTGFAPGQAPAQPPGQTPGQFPGLAPDEAPRQAGSASSSAWPGGSRSASRLHCRILRPADGSIYALDSSLPRAQQQVALEASAGGRAVSWQVDGRVLGISEPGGRLFWPLTPGSHQIRATAGESSSAVDEIRIVVEGPS
jgi:membrane carboxypeptidase/penicillin-binding protein PbpC